MAAVGAGLAVIGGIAQQSGDLLSFGRQYIVPLFTPSATFVVTIDPALGGADVFVADPKDDKLALVVAQAGPGRDATLTVPANVFYTVGWQGKDLKDGAAEKLLAIESGSRYRLARIGGSDDLKVLGLSRQADAGAGAEPDPTPTEPSASLLLSARSALAGASTSAAVVSGALPEFDRALAIVGLFETGTTDCARRFFVTPPFQNQGSSLMIGCVGVSSPGWLDEIVKALDGDARRLDSLVGDDAVLLRQLGSETADKAQLEKVAERLIALPEFRIAYQQRVLRAYAQSAQAARDAGLTSERARLLMFDRLVAGGPSALARAAGLYAQRYPHPPDGEAARLQALGDVFKSIARPPREAFSTMRVDTIVQGRGSVQGISFSLDALGIAPLP